MTDIQSPSTIVDNARSNVRIADKDTLITQLDELLERYLHTLDEYEKVRCELSKELSSGYMSLAQANFHNSSFRFGQDCYDERMQAIRKLNIKEPESGITDGRVYFTLSSSSESHHNGESTEKGTMDEPEDENQGASVDQEQPSESTKTESTSAKTKSAGADLRGDSKSKEEPTKDSSKVIDPLRWFGILVPPALRTAQSTFISAVEGPILRLATIARDLRAQEIEIGRVRKQIKKL